ncbi:DUF2630 family protein [Streptomyces nodosus]|uniref:DUF2630 family protein n=1 Tax=Streptomyces nodosus TaxID=40318 RepID=A0A0B5DJR5_9ACTN|nr:DUF2630 family protein [Streptomyces nodosus]AJE43923.1 hypothetical protein SNOD_30970 [Streptomyces nodosus]MBB4795489.1 stalled ribosome rescue protein Dom34 [Streptomyces nodosus]QEV42425.1 DUF2630 family protein [Streptomyces nodosus]
MAEEQIMARIAAMVDEERGLRDALSSGRIDSATEQERLAELERALDQCWDLLRQRRAKAEFGENPNEARVRPAAQVEDYKG